MIGRRQSSGIWLLAVILAAAGAARAAAPGLQPPAQPAQPAPAAQPTPAAAAPAAEKPPIKQEELEQMLAPLALYPDDLLTQILMASTYPVEIVQADRWTKEHASLKGDALATELEKQTWDPSVKSLVNFPAVLSSLSEKLDWTVKIGDAFIADQKRVLDTVQQLRAKAQAAGNLKTNEQQKVTVETVPGASSQVIVIQPSNPEVIYVPAYNPTVVYGSWPYPAYPPPVYYQPPYYPVASAAVGFGVGLAVGAAWGYAWGNCNWGHGDVNVNVNRNTNINTKIDRSKYQNNINRGNAGNRGGAGGNQWNHDPAHRQGVAYRDQATANKLGGTSSAQASQARDQFRGRADADRSSLQKNGAPGANRPVGSPAAGNTAARPSGAGAGTQNRPGGAGSGTQNRPVNPGTQNRSNPGAFDGMNNRGSDVRSQSQRGQSSRSASPSPSVRPSGGGSRGGGGGRGGGGRGGRR